MMKRNRIVLAFMTLMLLLPLGLNAQRLQIRIMHESKVAGKTELKPAEQVHVWVFMDDKHASKAQHTLKETTSYEEASKFQHQDMGVTDERGIVVTESNTNMLRGTAKSYVVIDAFVQMGSDMDANFAIMMPVAKMTKKTFNGDEIYEYTIKSNVEEMEEVKAEAKRKIKNKSFGRVIDNGRSRHLVVPVDIDSVHARNDARYVISPFLVVPAENFDTVGFLKPRVVDGRDYRKTMMRRMGDDLTHDKLWDYVEPDTFMVLRKSMHLDDHIGQEITEWDESRHYNMYAHEWYEDYNAVYYQGVRRIWDGWSVNYNRFLDWSSAKMSEPLDTTHYKQSENPEMKQSSQKYNITFVLGRAEVNEEDSISMLDLERMKSDISTFIGSDTRTMVQDGDTIRGWSSPEGGYSSNKDLAQRRAQHLYSNYLSSLFRQGGLPTPKVESNVHTWLDVANACEAKGDSIYYAIADEIRQIVSENSGHDINSNMAAQERIIRTKSWYKEYVYDQILPKLREVEFSYVEASYKVLSSDEIYERYKVPGSAYNLGNNLRGYEYYKLMNRLYEEDDYEGLERIADKALLNNDIMETVTRTKAERKTIMVTDSITHQRKEEWVYEPLGETNDYKRPYTLAAYYKAMCLLQKDGEGSIDTKLLKEYLDYSNNGYASKTPKMNFNGSRRGYWNEPGIVLEQVMMLCKDKDYNEANFVIQDHLEDDGSGKYDRLKLFIRALKSEYDDEGVRDTVALSSPLNFLVAWCGYADAKPDKAGYKMALNLIEGKMDAVQGQYPNVDFDALWHGHKLDSLSADVQYMKAICRFNLECMDTDPDAAMYPSNFIYNPDIQAGEDDPCWAAPMLKAVESKAHLNYLKSDGIFNDAYRTLVIFFHERLQQGATMNQIKSEYDALRNKYLMTEQK